MIYEYLHIKIDRLDHTNIENHKLLFYIIK